MIKKLEIVENYVITFTNEELAELGWKTGDKFTFKVNDDGSILMIPFAKLDIDLSKYTKSELISLINESCERDISVNEVIVDKIKEYLEKNKV